MKTVEAESRVKARCSVDGCERDARDRGWCSMHYLRWRRHGDTNALEGNKRHGLSRTPTFRVWWGMVARCEYENLPEYKHYGGRGITVCERWRGRDGFVHFLEDMGERPEGKYPSGHAMYTIDRIDVNGNYEPSNCRWATMSEQQSNKRPRTAETIEKMRLAARARIRPSLSPEEKLARRRQQQRERYHRLKESNPDVLREKWRNQAERRKASR